MSREIPNVNKTEGEPGEKRKRSPAVRVIAWTFLALLVLYLAVKMVLATPFAAGWLSGYLSESLHQQVSLASIRLSGVTVFVRGVIIANPEGFPRGALLTARSLRITPDVPEILSGKRALTLLQIEGLKINLGKNSAGAWNYQRLIQYLSRTRKRPAAELLIRQLAFREASVKISEFAVGKLALTVNDFSTKGTTDSKLVFTGTDEKGNPFRLAAEGRLGKDPDLRLTLVAPYFSLGTLGQAARGKSVFDLENGVAHLSLAVGFRSGQVSAKGHAAFDHLGVKIKQGKAPLRGTFDLAARYAAARDEASLDRISLVLNDTLRLDASGTVQHVKGKREFNAKVSCNEIRLKKLLAFLPKEAVRDITLNGSVTCGGLQLAGSGAEGITSGGGKFFLRNGEAVKGGRTLFQGLSSDFVIARADHGWNMGGKLSMDARAGTVPLENLDARFLTRFSNGFRPLSIEVPELKAGLMGVPVRGELTYEPGRPNPYRGMLYVRNAPLSAVNGLIGGKDISFSSGTADISLRGAGRGPESFAGEISARLSGLKAMVSGKSCMVKDGEITSRFSRSGGRLTAGGGANVEGGAYSGRNFSGTFAYALNDGKFALTGGKAAFDRAGIRFADISGRLPLREMAAGGARYPLVLNFTGLNVTADEVRAEDVSGSVSAAFTAHPGGGRLAGSASLAIPSVFFRSQPVGSVKAQVAMSDEGSVANINGTAFDGTLSSVVKLNPLAPGKGVSFKGMLQNAQAAKLSGMLPDRVKVRAPSGKFTMDLEGNWSADGGLVCRIEGSGTDMTLAAKQGKTFIAGAGITLKADVAGKDVSVKEATIKNGKEVALKIGGSLANAALPTRQGKFSLELETAPVASLLDTFANILPKPLQQADGGGNIGMRGTLGFAGEKIVLDGSIKCDNVLLDFPSQRVNITGVNGTLPFSLYLAGAKVERPADQLSFSRTNYPALLDTLRQRAENTKSGALLKIGKVRFGALETGDVRLRTQSGGGIVEISSIESSLYGGKMLAKGFLVYNEGLDYGVDVLINDMSLKQFCNSYPALKGYISGLLDGVISIYGGKGGLPAMVGFVDLWAHRGKGEKMLVSKEFLQKLAGKKMGGFFFRSDRTYDRGEISAYLQDGYLTFEQLDLSHTNFLGIKDLSVSVAPIQNKIGLEHLLQTIREAAARGKPAMGQPPSEPPLQPDLKWLE